MSIQPDSWIKKMSEEHDMIDPFLDSLIKENNGLKAISFGLSSYGYDIRVADEFKVFSNVHNSIVDPKNF